MFFPTISIKKVLVCFGCLFVAAVIFVSILGENNNGVNTARLFLTAVKERDHHELKRLYAADHGVFANKSESLRYHFMVELALLDHFQLLDADDYRVEIEADSLWFPFLSGHSLQLNVRLSPTQSHSLFDNDHQIPYINQAITAVREDGRWKIAGFNLEASPLRNNYQKIVSTVDYDQFLTTLNGRIALNQKSIDLNQMSGMDRKIFIHSLENAIESTMQKGSGQKELSQNL